MASGRNIKGITVEIGGDTTKLTSALSGVNKEIKNTQSQLKDVEKLLKLDPSNTELLAQKQKLLSQASTTNSALAKIDEVSGKFQQAGEKIAGVGKTLTATVTAPVVGLGAAAVKTAADFDSQMSKVAAISGATGDSLQNLRDKAREMGAKTKFSASEAGAAFEYMAMAGWKTDDMLSGIEGIMMRRSGRRFRLLFTTFLRWCRTRFPKSGMPSSQWSPRW